ncbi:MAG: cupin domain-containing protein [Devosia sp.]
MTTAQTPGTVHLLGNLVHFLARGADTQNAYSLVEVTTAPGAGTPPHVQKADDEAFYVLEGRYEFLHGTDTVTAGPGANILVKRGQAHAFRNIGDTPAKMLIINSPGGWHEGFFLEAGDATDPAKGFPPAAAPDMPRLVTAANRFGIEFLPPAN